MRTDDIFFLVLLDTCRHLKGTTCTSQTPPQHHFSGVPISSDIYHEVTTATSGDFICLFSECIPSESAWKAGVWCQVATPEPTTGARRYRNKDEETEEFVKSMSAPRTIEQVAMDNTALGSGGADFRTFRSCRNVPSSCACLAESPPERQLFSLCQEIRLICRLFTGTEVAITCPFGTFN